METYRLKNIVILILLLLNVCLLLLVFSMGYARLQAEHLVGPLPQGLHHLVAVHVLPLQQGQQQHPRAAGGAPPV